MIAAEAKAILGMQDDVPGLIGHGRICKVADLCFDQMPDACGLGVPLGGSDSIGVDVGGDDGWAGGTAAAGLGRAHVAADVGPCVLVEGDEVLESEAAAKQARGSSGRHERAFDGQRAAAAHWNDQWSFAGVASPHQDGCCERFAEWSKVWHFAVSAIGEFLTAGVDPDLCRLTVPVQVNDGACPIRTRVGAAAEGAANTINDGVLQRQAREHRIVDARMVDRAGHAQVPVEWDDVLPWNVRGGFSELLRTCACEGVEPVQHPHGNPRYEIESHGVEQGALAFDTRGATLLHANAELLEFGGKHVSLARTA